MQASAPPNCSNANRTAALSRISCKASQPSLLLPKISASASLKSIEACDLEGSRVFWLATSTPFAERSTRQSTIFSPSLAETTAKLAISPSVTAIFVPLSLLPFSSQLRVSIEGALVLSVCASVPIISPDANLGK